MVEAQTLSDFTPHFPDGERKRPLSAGAWLAIAVSAAAHVAVGVYLYNQHFVLQPPAMTEDAPQIIQIEKQKIDKPKPVKTVVQPVTKQLVMHKAVLTDITPTTPSVIPYVPPHPTPDIPGPSTAPVIETPTPPNPPVHASVIGSPKWIHLPSADQMAMVYPERAARLNKGGLATLTCKVTAGGAVHDCAVARETPDDMGFGPAALKLARYFQLSPPTEDGKPLDNASVNIPVRFNPPPPD